MTVSWDRPDRALESEVSGYLEVALEVYRKDPDLFREHVGLEQSFRTSGYSTRQFVELLQNAADANLNANQRGRVEFVLTPDTLYCANEGAPFSEQGIKSISHAYISAKRGEEIGRYGLGFKSVLALSERVQIFSRSVSFEFGSPQARSELLRLDPRAAALPILRTPTLIDVVREREGDALLAELMGWATTVVKLPLDRPEVVRAQLVSFRPEFLLFARSVAELTIRSIELDGTVEKRDYRCEDLGDGIYEVGAGEGRSRRRWLTRRAEHRPSMAARQEVADATWRDSFVITYAAPLEKPNELGEFWANFPLDARTSARGLFNAPWALNEDRTTILHDKIFNQEIIEKFSQLFLECLPLLRDPETAPAGHIAYLPSRPAETVSAVDKALITKIRYGLAVGAFIPDMAGGLRNGETIRSLTHGLPFGSDVHQIWLEAPHTPKDFPHPDIYATAETRARLRDMHRGAFAPDPGADARAAVPTEIGIASWLTMLANTSDVMYSGLAIGIADKLSGDSRNDRAHARIIALTTGERARPKDARSVFLPPSGDSDFGSYQIIDQELAADRRARKILEGWGFQQLSSEAVFDSQVSSISPDWTQNEWLRLWGAAQDVSPRHVERQLLAAQRKGSTVLLPTESGEWREPHEMFDLSHLGISTAPDVTLDSEVVNLGLARSLGVCTGVDPQFPVIEEVVFSGYRKWVLDEYFGESEDSHRSLAFDRDRGPGPIGILGDSELSDEANYAWSKMLVDASGHTSWVATHTDGRRELVPAPHVWALVNYGRVMTQSHGYVPAVECVDPALHRLAKLVPVPVHPNFSRLDLARTLDEISPDFLAKQFASFPEYKAVGTASVELGALLTDLVGVFGEDEDGWPSMVPAVQGQVVRPTDARHAYVAADADESFVLASTNLAFVRVDDDVDRARLTDHSPLPAASDALRSEIRPIDAAEPVPLVDLFPGLRKELEPRLQSIQLVEVSSVVTRRTTPVGSKDVEDSRLFDSPIAYIDVDPLNPDNERELLEWVNASVPLGLSAQALNGVLDQKHDAALERKRQELRASGSDVERIARLFDSATLEAKLPVGLLDALHALGKEVDEEGYPQLFLDTFGWDALSQLSSQLDKFGLQPPDAWTGARQARQFVAGLGFDERFAGQRPSKRETLTVVPGKPDLNQLHDYQWAALHGIRACLRVGEGEGAKALVELPTGAGKTRVAVESIVRAYLEHDVAREGHVLWIAQSQELCDQAANTWSEVWRAFGDSRTMEVARFYEKSQPDELTEDIGVVIATDAMLREHLETDRFDWIFDPAVIIVDEAHRAASASTYTDIFQRLGVGIGNYDRPLIGLSATPFRGRNEKAARSLAQRFGQNLITSLGDDPIRALQSRRVLAEIDHEVLPGTSVVIGDDERQRNYINRSTLSSVGADEDRMKTLVEHILKQPKDWQVLVFMPSVLSAQVLAAILRSEQIAAESVSGESSRRMRSDVIERFRKNDVRVLVNCDLLTQGFDAPKVRALYVARPTLSESLYVQMVGRGLRGPQNGGSDRCLVVDLEDTIENGSANLAYREFESFWRKV